MRAALYLSIVVLGASACAVSPRYRDEFQSRSTAITFSGLTPFPGETITIVVGCTTGPRSTLAHTTTGTSVAVTDSGGTPWYSYSTSVVIPNSQWCATNVGPSFPLQQFFTYAGTNGSRSGSLGVFASREHGPETGSVALEDCATAQMTGGQIRTQCALDVPQNLALIYAGN